MHHPRDPPLDNVAKVLIIDIIILPANRPLCSFLQLILSISEGPTGLSSAKWSDRKIKNAYTLTRQSLLSTAMILFSSFG
jgi:hypothetical protein